jgi:hypothetical protein
MKKTGRKQKGSISGQDLRNLGIMEAAASGKKQSDIAEDFGISRQSVNKILNSEDTRKLTEEATNRLKGLLGKAIDTVEYCLDSREEAYGKQPALTAGLSVLKGLGVLTDKVKHEGLKPFVMKLIGGGEIVMGHKAEDEKDNNNEEGE